MIARPAQNIRDATASALRERLAVAGVIPARAQIIVAHTRAQQVGIPVLAAKSLPSLVHEDNFPVTGNRGDHVRQSVQKGTVQTRYVTA
jgi:hypothetical protein